MEHWSQKMLDILDSEGVDYPEDIIKIITPFGDMGTAKYFKEVLHVRLSIDEMLRMMDESAIPKYRDIITLKDGVFEYLKLLKTNGCSLNVLTASPHKMLDSCLKRNGVYDMFDNVWSCDDFGTTKADVRIYHEAVRKMGTTEGEVVFLDDNIAAVKTAAQAGLYTVGVYDKSGEDFTELMKKTADLYVKSFKGLGQI